MTDGDRNPNPPSSWLCPALSLSEPEPRSPALAPTLERSPQQAADQSPDKKSGINGEQFAEGSLKLRTFNDQK